MMASGGYTQPVENSSQAPPRPLFTTAPGSLAAALADKPKDVCLRIFVAGAVTHCGKTTVCLSLLSAFREAGLAASDLAYIKPATQCEAPDLLKHWCDSEGVKYVSGEDAPLVFFSGFTRSFLDGEQGTSAHWLDKIKVSVDALAATRQVVVIDGVGFPSVGSIVGVDNADVARIVDSPVLLVGKSGVGGAVDSYNLNRVYFESKGVRVLGSVFNFGATEGFYAWDQCAVQLQKYFAAASPARGRCYGVIPSMPELDGLRERIRETEFSGLREAAALNASHFSQHCDLAAIIMDALGAQQEQPLPADHKSMTSDATPGTQPATSAPKSRDEVTAQAKAQGRSGGMGWRPEGRMQRVEVDVEGRSETQ